MPAPQRGYPIANVVSFLLGYLQELIFSNPNMVNANWAYDRNNERGSRIRISGPFVIDNQKPYSQPFIVIERGEFSFKNRTINDTKRADANTTENEERVLIPDGVVLITCGSAAAAEASSLANFIAIVINAGRESIYKGSRFIRFIRCITIGPEVPVSKGHKIQRYEVTVAFQVGLQFGFTYSPQDPQKFNKFSLSAVKKPYEYISLTGSVTLGSPIFSDFKTRFGEDILFYPQELANNWYKVFIKSKPELELVIDSINYEPAEPWGNSLNIKIRQEDGTYLPWDPDFSLNDISYSIWWNNIHLFFNYPGNDFYEYSGNTGEITENSPIFTDTNVKWGEDFTFVPHYLKTKKYRIVLEENPELKIYIDSIVLEPNESWGYSLNMQWKNERGEYINWYPDFTEIDLDYYIAIN